VVPLKGLVTSLFKPFDLPLSAREILQQEGLLFLAERVRLTVVYHRYKAAGRNFRNKKETTWGAVGISRKRIVGYTFGKRVIHLPFYSDQISAVKFSCVDEKALVISVEPGLIDPERSGRMELRFHTPEALEAYNIIRDLTS